MEYLDFLDLGVLTC